MTELSKSGEYNAKKFIEIKEKYCTRALIKKIDKEELEGDPFLKAQDTDIESLKTLVVKKDSSRDNQYIVYYIANYDKTKILINLKLKKEKDQIKIDSVW